MFVLAGKSASKLEKYKVRATQYTYFLSRQNNKQSLWQIGNIEMSILQFTYIFLIKMDVKQETTMKHGWKNTVQYMKMSM